MQQDRQDFDFRLPFRAGWPKLPCLPLQTCEVVDAKIPGFAASRGAIRQILHDHLHIDMPYFTLAYRFHTGEPTDNQLTLFMTLNINDGPGIEGWQAAVWHIRNELSARDININIELVDHAADWGITSAPILSSERDLLQAWRSCSMDIADTIAGHQWITLDLVHREQRGVRNSEIKATIVISAKDADHNTWWEETIPAIREKVPPYFAVELFYLHDIHSYGTNEIEIYRSERSRYLAYLDTIEMGASCGVEGRHGSGTIGGGFRLKEESDNFAITNHHVISHGNPKPIRSANGLVVVSPSDDDHQKIQEEECRDISRLKGVLKNQSGRHRIDVLNDIDWLERKRAKLSQANRTFGTILASSGWRAVVNDRVRDEDLPQGLQGEQVRWVLDWALIKSNERSVQDSINNLPHNRPDIKLKADDSATAYQTIQFHKTYDVAKYGRTTGWTTGTINAAESYHNSDETVPYSNIKKYRVSKKTPYYGKGITVAHCILPRQRAPCPLVATFGDKPNLGDHGIFCLNGDSGSLVLLDQNQSTHGEDKSGTKGQMQWEEKLNDGNRKAPIVGLLFGGNLQTACCYMTPMDILVKDICEVTKMEVSQPKANGEAIPRDD